MRLHPMHMTPSVFLDTTVLKASVDTRMMLLPEPKKVRWGDQEFEVNVHRPVFVNQNIKYLQQGNRERFEDTLFLRFIAALAKEQKIILLSHNEVFFELMHLPRTTGEGPRFYGAPIQEIEGPVQYGRIIADWSKRDYQFEFLAGLKHPRFLELQRACGAFQGHNRPPHRNQLIDAFHLLCAESADAKYFLTLDDSLIRTLSTHKTYKVNLTCITPKQLLIALISRRPTWFWSMLKERWRIARSGRKLDEEAQDASREFWT